MINNYPHSLLRREWQVWRLFGRGYTWDEVQGELGIRSRNTLHNHAKRLYAKLGVGCRQEAAVSAWYHEVVHRD